MPEAIFSNAILAKKSAASAVYFTKLLNAVRSLLVRALTILSAKLLTADEICFKATARRSLYTSGFIISSLSVSGHWQCPAIHLPPRAIEETTLPREFALSSKSFCGTASSWTFFFAGTKLIQVLKHVAGKRFLRAGNEGNVPIAIGAVVSARP